MKPYIVPDSRHPYGICCACDKKSSFLICIGEEPGGFPENLYTFLCKGCVKEGLELLESREAGKGMSFDDKVLQVFLDFPDSEMRTVDVQAWFRSNGKNYNSRTNFGEACARLHRQGQLFKRKEGNRVWYCIARRRG